MTIKRRLFISNIRMVLIPIFGVVLIALVNRLVMTAIFRANELVDMETYTRLQWSSGLISVPVFVVLIIVINSILTNRMTKKITLPLEILNKGVGQIHANDFSFRVEYSNNDEFRPVCEAFNDMAARLETSTAEKQKDEANRRELIAGISHDLRTPLTSIKGYIEGLETGVASTEEMQKKYLAIIKNKTADMEHIIEQLFLFSKLDMDEFQLNLRRTDIGLAVSDIIEDCLTEYASRGLAITLAELPKKAIVYADVLALRNVIINILENSVKYKTKEQGQMAISAALDNNSIVLKFTDDGPGVNTDVLSKIFNVFYRSDPARNKKGSGLGLAISAKIIERMNGSIRAELPAAELPTTGGFTITLILPLLQGENE